MSIARTNRITLADYHEMIARGILTRNDRVEFISGEIIEKMPIGPLHAACVRKLTELFGIRLGGRSVVSVQNPILLIENEPEPDIVLLKPREDYYVSAHPTPSDVLLVIEVADETIDFDRDVKRTQNAQNGVVEYWILDVDERTAEIHRQPQSDGYYEHVRLLSSTETTDIERLPGEEFIVGELFPPAVEPR